MKIDLPIIAKKNDKDLIQQYYPLHNSAFLSHVKSGLDALGKMVELKGEQVTEQERAAVHGLKALYESRVVEDVERDLENGHVSMETVEKRVRLDVDACKVIIERMNPTPIVYEPINVLMLAWESGMTNKK